MDIIHKINNSIKNMLIVVETSENSKEEFNKIYNLLKTLEDGIKVINAINNREVIVPLREISVIQSESRMCNIILENKKFYLMNKRLKDMESILLKKNYFLKINKTIIINIFHVKEFSMIDNFRIELILKNSLKYIVNRSFTSDFKDRMEELIL